MIKIAPSILTANFGILEEYLKAIDFAGADILHLDVMDGCFVPPISFGDSIISGINKATNIFLETHLMVVNPLKHVDAFINAGSDRIIFHLESDQHANRTLNYIKEYKVSNGIAINPSTSPNSLEYLLDSCDVVLVMSVNPGWGGQKFLNNTLKKIEKIKEMILKNSLPTLIEVDGGINEITSRLCIKAGADILVAGSYLLKPTSLDKNELKHKVELLKQS